MVDSLFCHNHIWFYENHEKRDNDNNDDNDNDDNEAVGQTDEARSTLWIIIIIILYSIPTY